MIYIPVNQNDKCASLSKTGRIPDSNEEGEKSLQLQICLTSSEVKRRLAAES